MRHSLFRKRAFFSGLGGKWWLHWGLAFPLQTAEIHVMTGL